MTDAYNARKARGKRPFPLWTDALLRDVMHLSAEEVGAYMLILMAMWKRETATLPLDHARLARIARINTRRWRSTIWPEISNFFQKTEGEIRSTKLTEVAAEVERFLVKQSTRKRGLRGYSQGQKRNEVLRETNTPPTDDKSLNNNKSGQSAEPSVDISADQPRNHPRNHPNQESNRPIESLAETHRVAFAAYNDFADRFGWTKCQAQNKQRTAAIKARMMEAGGLEGWRVALDKASQSPFLMGQTKADFRLHIDFLLQASSFTKLMEGAYDARERNSGSENDNSGVRRDSEGGSAHDAHGRFFAGFAEAAGEAGREERGSGDD